LKSILGKAATRGLQSLELYEAEEPGAKAGASKSAAARVVLSWTISDILPASHFGI
jgi:hypothetical protein